jgi:hypothetical protein
LRQSRDFKKRCGDAIAHAGQNQSAVVFFHFLQRAATIVATPDESM